MQSTNGIQLTMAAEDAAPQTDLSSQLLQLIHESASSGDSLARAPLIELLKHQAEQVPATAYQQTIPVWQLTGAESSQAITVSSSRSNRWTPSHLLILHHYSFTHKLYLLYCTFDCR